MAKDVVKVGLLGLGTVGSGTVNILKQNKIEIKNKVGAEIQVTKALVRNIAQPRAVDLEGLELVTDAQAILADPEIDVVVELMGGVSSAKTYMETALKNGKYVVTANKDLMAQYGSELLKLAKEHNCSIYYEASVGGGIPLIRTLKHCLAANRITSIMGIINGTTNYILTQMSREHKEFAIALQEAQESGFAEADPSSDLDGRDAAYKLSILANIAFNTEINMDDVYTESMRGVSLTDIKYAKELGFTIKLLAIGTDGDQGMTLRVHPTLIPQTHPLASVNNEFNAVYINGDAVGEVMLYGRGAGSLPTGSAVAADIIDAVRSINHQVANGICMSGFVNKPVISMDKQISRFYVRMQAINQSGVFASLATAFGDEQVSLDMIMQKSYEKTAEVVLVTHEVTEHQFNQAIDRVNKLATIKEVSSVIRVLEGN